MVPDDPTFWFTVMAANVVSVSAKAPMASEIVSSLDRLILFVLLPPFNKICCIKT